MDSMLPPPPRAVFTAFGETEKKEAGNDEALETDNIDEDGIMPWQDDDDSCLYDDDDEDDDDEEEEVVPMKVESNHLLAVGTQQHPPTSTTTSNLTTFVETQHGRLRRRQRGLDQKDLQNARKYGTAKAHVFKNARGKPKHTKYSYKGIHYIVENSTGREVTSFADPLILDPVPLPATPPDEIKSSTKTQVTSHTVLVVDTSGSMRSSDVWGARNRLNAVWIALALDFVAHRLETGEANSSGGQGDLVSLITMSETASIVFRKQPCDWKLYNRIVALQRKPRLVCPKGHGYFVRGIHAAAHVLDESSNSAAALSLVFLTDGRPSDRRNECERQLLPTIRSLAERYGRRLSFSAVGMGDGAQFDLLERMVSIFKDFGCPAEMQRPSLASAAIGSAFSSAASSLLVSKLEMQQREIRPICKESLSQASVEILDVEADEFLIYDAAKSVRRLVYREYWDESRKRHREFVEAPFLAGQATKYIAISKKPFGEGAERFVYRFFEIGADGKTVVGEALVAKETRHVLSSSPESDSHRQGQFVRTFCAAQQISLALAEKFNNVLNRATPKIHPGTPRVSFLDCSVYEIESPDGSTTRTVLVEPKVDHRHWFKWNANNGYVATMTSAATQPGQPSVSRLRLHTPTLAPIAENTDPNSDIAVASVRYNATQVAQAFSHFTYIVTGKKRLVCDLQGVVAGGRMLRLSDPVIHYHDPGQARRKHVHGATDRGRKGIDLFFGSHRCSGLCRLVTKGFRTEDGTDTSCALADPSTATKKRSINDVDGPMQQGGFTFSCKRRVGFSQEEVIDLVD